MRDPDNPPLTDEQLAQFRRMKDVRPELVRRFRAQRGLQKSTPLVLLRLDPDIIAHFKKRGPGWQSRINATLRKTLKLPKLA